MFPSTSGLAQLIIDNPEDFNRIFLDAYFAAGVDGGAQQTSGANSTSGFVVPRAVLPALPREELAATMDGSLSAALTASFVDFVANDEDFDLVLVAEEGGGGGRGARGRKGGAAGTQ